MPEAPQGGAMIDDSLLALVERLAAEVATLRAEVDELRGRLGSS
jgi:hypothetical protein